MKLCFKSIGFILITCFMILSPIKLIPLEYISTEAEVTTTLPLLSTDGDSSDIPDEDSQWEESPDQNGAVSYGENTFVPCTIGLLTYYNQADPRWADTLYGSSDPMRTHGCGPTALAMIVTSYTGTVVTPPDMAAWASDNGYYSRGEGSRHALIPEGLAHFGLSVTPLVDRSTEAVLNQIRSGKIVVALMNKGYFTNGGHFLLLTQVLDDGTIRMADPANWENTSKTWDPEFILSQLRSRAEAGGPLWAVELPPEA